jgi:hypothetical protein
MIVFGNSEQWKNTIADLPDGFHILTNEQRKLVELGLLTLFWQYRAIPDEQAKVNAILELCLKTNGQRNE